MDTVGQSDELIEALRDVALPVIQSGRGRVADRVGQMSLLIEFQSVKDALDCAKKVFAAAAVRNAAATPDSLLRIRSGIDAGSVVDTDNGPAGEAADLATRLRLFETGGGVFLSKAAAKALGASASIELDDLGAKIVKGVAQPVEAFALKATRPVKARDEQTGPDIDASELAGEEGSEDEVEKAIRKKQAEEIKAALAPAVFELTSKALDVAVPKGKAATQINYGQALELRRGDDPDRAGKIFWSVAGIAVVGALGFFLANKQSAVIQRLVGRVTNVTTTAATSVTHTAEVFGKAADGQDVPGVIKAAERAVVTNQDAIESTLAKCGQDAEKCRTLAENYRASKAPIIAFKLYDVACKANDAASCLAMGELYAAGEGVERSVPQAKAYFDAVCKAGNTTGCQALAKLTEDPESRAPANAAR